MELVAGIDPSLLSVAEEIGRAVEEDGSDLKDSASPPLRRLRRELREGRGRLAERLRKIARDPAARRAPPGRLRHRARRPPRAGAEGVGPRARARHRARLLRLGPDALRRAARGRRRLEPAARGRGRRARRGGADPAQPLVARRRAGRGARRARRRDGRARPRARPRQPLARLAGSARGAEPRRRPARGAPPAARPGDGRADRPRARRASARS